MSSEQMKLSILDLATVYNNESPTQTLQNSTDLVQLADRLGYTRYWFAEHHNTKYQMSTSPDILSAHAAAVTKRIRVGSGGIMIPNHSPLKVAENFSILETLHPDRIDLGMGRASGTDPITQMALGNTTEPMGGHTVMEKLSEILAYFRRDFPAEHPFSKISPSPDASIQPELFMLGSTNGGMEIASELGIGFAFAGQINPDWAVPMLRQYREKFQATDYRSTPYSILSLIVICAETDQEAAYHAGPAELQWVRWGTGNFKLPPPTTEEAANHPYTEKELQMKEQNKGRFVIGSPKTVKEKLDELKTDAQVDEIMIMNMIPDKKAREQSYQLLSDVYRLS